MGDCLLDEDSGSWAEIVFMSCGFGLDEPQPRTRVARYKEILEGWQFTANHLLCRENNTLQSALVRDSGSRIPDGDGGGDNGLCDDGVEMYYDNLWQVVAIF